MARITDEGWILDTDGKPRKGWKPKQPWRPKGWEPAPVPERISIEVYQEAQVENAHRRKAHNRDQTYKPDDLQMRAEVMARRVAGAALDRPRLPDPRLMSDHELREFAKALVEIDRYDWRGANARPEQIMPEGFDIWLLMAGRGFGKTRCAAEAVREVCEGGSGMSAAVIAKDHRALRDVCFEGRSGLLNCIPPKLWNPKDYHKGLGDVSLTLLNGSVMRGYTAGEPDAVRGQAFDIIWGDEFAAWPRSRAQDMLDQALLCLREAEDARAILSTTPKRVPHVVELLELAKDPEYRIVITRGSSRDNKVLTESWHRQMEKRMGGTRLARQELHGELVMDAEKALWTGFMIEAARWDLEDNAGEIREYPRMHGVITGVDPSGSKDGDATGIVTVGWDRANTLYVIENRTTAGLPAHRYSEACRSAARWGAMEIWYESAYGGDNAAYGIEQAWKNLQEAGEIDAGLRCPPTRASTIKGDKAARAMPCVQLYEQQMNVPDRRRIFHPQPSSTNGIAQLEDEMLQWETNSKKSPNAIDALVHAVRQVLIRTGQEMSLSVPARVRRIEGGYRVF